MNSEIDEHVVEETDSEDLSSALFFGDTGQMPLGARRVFALLLQGPSLESRRHSKLWPILIQHEVLVRSRLADLFLELVIDREQEVAFTRQAETSDLEVPRLLRRAQLRFLDSVLLLYLRSQLVHASAQGDRAVVATNEMQEHLLLYERTGNTDRAGFMKRVNSAIDKLKQLNILHKLRGTEDRFEVSATLKLLFPAEAVQALSQLYLGLAVQGALVADSGEASAATEDSE